jgi:mono/diheme cytochrome c family protein
LLAPAALVALCLGGLAGRLSAQAGPRRPAEPTRPARPSSEQLHAARQLFQRRCAGCHDSDGSGGVLRGSVPLVPDFTNSRWQQRRRDEQLVVSILEGKGSRMPSFHGRVSEEGAQDLVSLIRTFDPTYDPAAAARSAVTASEFSRRFRELDQEMEELKKQFRELSAPRRPR